MHARMWHAVIRSAHVGFERKLTGVWSGVVLQGHLFRDTLVAFEGLRDVHELLIAFDRKRSMDYPYNARKTGGAVIANTIPPAYTGFVDSEMLPLTALGCVAKCKHYRGRAGPDRPPLIQGLSVEETYHGTVHAALPLDKLCRRIRYAMDTIARVGNLASEGFCQGSLFDSSALFTISCCIRPRSRCLVRPTEGGGDHVRCVSLLRFCGSPYVYHAFSRAKVAYLRSNGTLLIALA